MRSPEAFDIVVSGVGVTSICANIGCAEEHHLRRSLRRNVGITASQYRARFCARDH